jgi:hypothetical protein
MIVNDLFNRGKRECWKEEKSVVLSILGKCIYEANIVPVGYDDPNEHVTGWSNGASKCRETINLKV